MRRILLALALLLGSLGVAEAQVSTCPLTTQAKIVSSSSYTVQTSDKCLLVVLTATGTINVVLPAPGLIFAPGFYTTLFPLNGGTLSMTGMPDDAGKLHKINQQTSYVFGAAQGANLSVLQDFNWWGVPTGASGAAGSGTVTSVGLTSPGGIFAATGTNPITTTGSFGYTTTGTSGGIPYFSTGSQLSSSAALTANAPVLGGGAGASPIVGSRSGNTTTFGTTSGTLTSTHLAAFDASGNIVDGGAAGTGITQLTGPVTTSTGGGVQSTAITNGAVTNAKLANSSTTVNGATCTLGSSCTLTRKDARSIGWPAGIDPNNNVVATVPAASTVVSIEGYITVAVGATATFDVYKVPASTAPCSSGTKLNNSTPFNGNATAGTNQQLTLSVTSLSAHDSICIASANGANWIAGAGIGGITVETTTP